MRKLLLALGAVASVLALAGCDHFAADPIAFTRVDGIPVVRVCLPSTISSIELKAYSSDEDYTGTPVWSANGSFEVGEGGEFALGAALSGMTVTSGTANISDLVAELGERYAITIAATDDHGAQSFFASIESSDFDRATWLNAYGPVESPCVRAPCPPGWACHNRWPQPSGPAIAPEPTWTPGPTP